MLDAIALYFVYQSSCITSLRIVTTDLDLLPYASRKGKTDSDLIRNTVLLWNNVVFCVIFKRKELRFRFLRQYAVFCAVLKLIWWLVLFVWVCSLIYQSNYCLNWWFFLLRWWTLVSPPILACVSAKNFDFRFLTCDAVICEAIESNEGLFWSYDCAL